MTDLPAQIRALDPGPFSFTLAQSTEWDRRALLSLHAATAEARGTFDYLEIGSYLGGSLQAVVRDPRCTRIVSIDPRSPAAPDERTGTWQYSDNTTEEMLQRLASVPDADLGKIVPIEASTETIRVEDLPCQPDLCFIDGEHTNEAALRDARSCAEAVGGRGIVAFHDYDIVAPAIRAFIREAWADVSLAMAFTGAVFAAELGGQGLLRSPIVARAVGSAWHLMTWMSTSRWRPSPAPLLAAWSAMPTIDRAVANLRTYAQGRGRRTI